MKKVLAFLLVLCLALSLAACTGTPAGGTEGTGSGNQAGGNDSGFRVGFGRADITPKESVPMASYGNAKERMSEGLYTYLYINVLAIGYGEDTMLLMTIDHSWFSSTIADPLKEQIADEYGIPQEYILMQGTHTHAGPEVGQTDVPAMGRENTRTMKFVMEAVGDAIADMKPAEIYVGSVVTEGMNFVRRYIMDDGSLIGDNYEGTGTTIVKHETDADPEMQLMKFAREGGKDIVICNFQAHPHLEGKNPYLSYQTVGATRTAVEELLDVHCIGWQGAAGNLNSSSRITEENRFTKADREFYGETMANYVASVYDTMTKVEAGPIKVLHESLTCEVNHTEDHLYNIATEVNQIWTSTNNSSAAMAVGSSYGIKSVYHANAIINKYSLADTRDLKLTVFSFGDVSGVVVPYEMFDTSGMQIKSQTPFEKTFIFGYANTGDGGYGYMPDEAAYVNIGYEGNQCRYVPGTAEKLVAKYLEMLGEIHE